MYQKLLVCCLIISLVLLIGLALVTTPIEEPEVIDNGCLVEHYILFPESANLVGRALVDATGIEYQRILRAGLNYENGKEYYFIDGERELAIGQLCWTGNPLAPTPTFLNWEVIPKDPPTV